MGMAIGTLAGNRKDGLPSGLGTGMLALSRSEILLLTTSFGAVDLICRSKIRSTCRALGLFFLPCVVALETTPVIVTVWTT
jgi:hypothetical protein